MTQIFLIISSVFALITSIFGIYFIFKGEYKPQRMTRTISVIINTIFVLSLFFGGDKSAIYLAMGGWISSIIIFILAFKYGIGGKSKFDFLVLGLSITSIIIWKITDNPIIALYFSIFAGFFGMIPTVFKSYMQQYTENPIFYASDIIASFFSCLAVFSLGQSSDLAKISYPLYILIINLLCFILIILGRHKLNKINQISKIQNNQI